MPDQKVVPSEYRPPFYVTALNAVPKAGKRARRIAKWSTRLLAGIHAAVFAIQAIVYAAASDDRAYCADLTRIDVGDPYYYDHSNICATLPKLSLWDNLAGYWGLTVVVVGIIVIGWLAPPVSRHYGRLLDQRARDSHRVALAAQREIANLAARMQVYRLLDLKRDSVWRSGGNVTLEISRINHDFTGRKTLTFDSKKIWWVESTDSLETVNFPSATASTLGDEAIVLSLERPDWMELYDPPLTLDVLLADVHAERRSRD